MALQSTGSRRIVWPGYTDLVTGNNPSFGARANLSAGGNYFAYVEKAMENMTISHVGIYLGAVTGSPVGDLRIETVDTSGLPTGTLWSTTTNISTGTLSSGWSVHALTSSASITRGDVFAVRLNYTSGTNIRVDDITSTVMLYHHVLNGTASAQGIVPWGIGSSATSMYKLGGAWPISGLSSANTNNTDSARRGMLFQVPFKCRVVGCRYVMPASSSGDFDVGIRDNAGTEVSSSLTTVDRSQLLQYGNQINEVMFDSSAELSIGTNYRLSFEPTSATNVTLYHVTVSDQAIRSGLPGGTACQLTTYTTSGGWVDSATTTVPMIDLVIDQLDDGVSTGGRAKVIGG